MGQTIVSDAHGWGSVRESLWGGVQEYGSFTPMNIYAALPTAGSADHDGRIAQAARSGLTSFVELVQQDADLTQRIHDALQETDAHAAASLAGGAER
ncbi:MAG: hypothetical protein Q4A01_05035 [Coriobacteriales bacterium]|nr:hypothetical protein [Coriobacteriales bacterium]